MEMDQTFNRTANLLMPSSSRAATYFGVQWDAKRHTAFERSGQAGEFPPHRSAISQSGVAEPPQSKEGRGFAGDSLKFILDTSWFDIGQEFFRDMLIDSRWFVAPVPVLV